MVKTDNQTRKNTKNLIERLESMPFEEARSKILREEMGNQIGSPNHQICLSWLSLKESKFCEDRELKTLCWARHAAYGAYAAAIIAAISIVITIGIHLFTKAP
jgi:hypothetical protein